MDFYIVSKILGLALKPLAWVVLLGLIALLSRRPARKRRSLRLAMLVLVVFSNPWILNQCLLYWEAGHHAPEQITTPYDVGIVLGGYHADHTFAPPGVFTTERSSNRLIAALQLYKTGKIRRILLSGGSGSLLTRDGHEAANAAAFLRQVGVAEADILQETQSRNTLENAQFSQQLLSREMPGARCLLITSAFHMRRAWACFQKSGVPCDPFAADFMAEQTAGNPLRWLEPKARVLYIWEFLIKEWIGWVAYRIKGRI